MTSHNAVRQLTSGSRRPRAGSQPTIPTMCAIVLAMLVMVAPALAQTYNVIYNFTGGNDGASPFAGLSIDAAGRLYGTAFAGGSGHFGTVFELKRSGSGWTLDPLYTFSGGNDGEGPVSRVVRGLDGALYGATSAGGGGACNTHNGYLGCGTIYKLLPPATAPGSVIVNWSSATIYRFSGTDGAYPQGDLTFDAAGNMYGTTINGGSAGWGTIYKLVPHNGSWSHTMLYQAQGDGDGEYAWGGIVFDRSGNIYGVFSANGPDGYGAVYKLAPAGSGWNESTVHAFSYQGDDGANPQGGLIADSSGNLYGSTVHSRNGGGTVFELATSGGSWDMEFLAGLSGGIDLGPYDKLAMDAHGNLYGTTFAEGQYGLGSVFKLTPSSGGWSYSSLHDFAGGSDGANPMCSLVFDSEGNLYGTASGGGASGKGVVFQIRP